MGHYSDRPGLVRVDFFKEWYASQAIDMSSGYNRPSIHGALKIALNEQLAMPDGRLRYGGMTAVCLEPYHVHEHPIMLTLPHHGPFILTDFDKAEPTAADLCDCGRKLLVSTLCPVCDRDE